MSYIGHNGLFKQIISIDLYKYFHTLAIDCIPSICYFLPYL